MTVNFDEVLTFTQRCKWAKFWDSLAEDQRKVVEDRVRTGISYERIVEAIALSGLQPPAPLTWRRHDKGNCRCDK